VCDLKSALWGYREDSCVAVFNNNNFTFISAHVKNAFTTRVFYGFHVVRSSPRYNSRLLWNAADDICFMHDSIAKKTKRPNTRSLTRE